jgi:hypothetical protein
MSERYRNIPSLTTASRVPRATNAPLLEPPPQPQNTIADLAQVARDEVDPQENQWKKLHTTALVLLAEEGVFPDDLKKLTKKACELRGNSKLSHILSGQVMGINIETGIKTPWEVSSKIVPFYMAAAFGLTANVLKKSVAYKAVYAGYFECMNAAKELVEEDANIQNDLQKVVQMHAKKAYVFVATYYRSYWDDKKNIKGASKQIAAWAQKFSNSWNKKIKVIIAIQAKKAIQTTLQMQGEESSDSESDESDNESSDE